MSSPGAVLGMETLPLRVALECEQALVSGASLTVSQYQRSFAEDEEM